MEYRHFTNYHNYVCPSCKNVLKQERGSSVGNDDCLSCACYIMFLPLWLIIWGISWIIKRGKDETKKVNSRGEEIVCCRHCKSYVVITTTGTRLLMSDIRIYNHILPDINNIKKYGIACNIINHSNGTIDEKLELEFINKSNKKCYIKIELSYDSLYITSRNEKYLYSYLALKYLVLKELLSHDMSGIIDGETYDEYVARVIGIDELTYDEYVTHVIGYKE